MKGWKPLPNERSELGGGGCHIDDRNANFDDVIKEDEVKR